MVLSILQVGTRMPMVSGETTIRVRYAETDRMGLLHHANYLVYFEQGRTELLRSHALAYKDFEDQGYLLVLTRAEIRYRSPGDRCFPHRKVSQQPRGHVAAV